MTESQTSPTQPKTMDMRRAHQAHSSISPTAQVQVVQAFHGPVDSPMNRPASVFLMLLTSLFMTISALGQEPLQISKVDPPSWWVRSKTNPVRVLVAGKGLGTDLEIKTPSEHVQATNLRASENGHYLFFDLHIGADCRPGSIPIELIREDANGLKSQTSFDWQILEYPTHEPAGFEPTDFIYFLMPDRFCDGDPTNNQTPKSPDILDRKKSRFYHGGDIRGIEEKLSYLESLGATAIWTTPIYDNNDHPDLREMHPEPGGTERVPTTGYHGYGAIDLYNVDEHFGTLDELKRWIRSAHDRGMKVIQDQVANHTGPYHAWVQDPPTPTWWNGTVDSHLKNNWQKWTAMNPRASFSTQQSNLEGWFGDVLPDLNQNDPEVSRYLIQHSIWWLGVAGFDAIRMDTLPHVPRSFWGAWGAAVKKEFPRTKILGELYDSDPVLVSYFQGGRIGHDGIDTHIDTLFDFPMFTPIRHAFGKGGSLREVHQMFSRDWLYVDPNRMATFLGVHDMPRFMNERGATLEGLKNAFTLIMTSRGTPILYYGDELAMPGGEDPDNRRDFPGGFPGDSRNAFVDMDRTDSEKSIWNHLSKLGTLRKSHPALATGRTIDLFDAEQQYAYARIGPQDAFVVVFNNSEAASTIEFDVATVPSQTMTKGWSFQCDDLLSVAQPLQVQKGRARVNLSGHTGAIYRLPE